MCLLDTFLLEPAPGVNVWIASRADSAAGSGTLRDPFNGSNADAFDAVMRKLSALGKPVRINLGSGMFYTRGYSDSDPERGWQPSREMKIFGAGIHATTLKLVDIPSGQHCWAVGHPLSINPGYLGAQVDFFEIGDLTIDCGIGDGAPADLVTGAIRIKGTHSRIRRVRAINWGSKSVDFASVVIASITADSASPFTINLAAPNSAATIVSQSAELDRIEIFDTIIEQCIVESPCPGMAGPATMLYLGGRPVVALAAGPEAIPYACGESAVIRECVLNGTPPEPEVSPFDLDIRGIEVGWCHGAILEGNHISNMVYGGPYQVSRSLREVIARGNVYSNVIHGAYLTSSANTEAAIDIAKIRANQATEIEDPLPFQTASIITSRPHFFFAGDWVSISGTSLADPTLVQIRDVRSATEFYIPSSADPGSQEGVGTVRKLGRVHKVLFEGNLVELATLDTSTPHEPAAVSINQVALAPAFGPDLIIRHNRIRYVNAVQGDFAGKAINVDGANRVIISNNMVDDGLGGEEPFVLSACQYKTFLENRTFSGELLPRTNADTGKPWVESERPAEEAFALACFDR